MNLLLWIILGLLIGTVVNTLQSNLRQERIENIILGILGAVFGGLLANLQFGTGLNNFSLISISVSLLAAILLTVLPRTVKKMEQL